jgi:hypothetical protein
MSQRHRKPEDLERAPKRERRWSTHRERRAVRTSLMAAPDPEEILTPDLNHHGPHRGAETGPKRRQLRHWKVKAWKRRSAQRRARALALQALAKSP